MPFTLLRRRSRILPSRRSQSFENDLRGARDNPRHAIYNFDASSALKNLIELTGESWDDKIVGFLCAAGGSLSYMSVMSLANSLMLDFRCLIIPRFVFATGSDFEDLQLSSAELRERIQRLATASTKIRNN